MHGKKESIKFIEACYQLYEQKMYQAAYKILHDSSLAEDAVQDAFLKLMQRKIWFDDPKSDDTKRYIITVIKHSSIDIYNKKKKEQSILYLSEQDSLKDCTIVPDDTDVKADMEELISSLPPVYYETVVCLVIKNLSVKETAAKLGITDTAVRKRFERAKRMLKNKQKGCEGHEAAKNKLFRANTS